MLSNKTRENRLDTHLKAIAGFEYILPAEFSKDDYRLNITYFSGDPNRGDIHVRAIIEDVVPSTAIKLEKISRAVQQYAIDVAQNMMELSEDNRNRILRIYGSLPYLLVNALVHRICGQHLIPLCTTQESPPADSLKTLVSG